MRASRLQTSVANLGRLLTLFLLTVAIHAVGFIEARGADPDATSTAISTPTSTSTSATRSRLRRVEPPNWWIGMHQRRVQLMLYGQAIAELEPHVQHPGVRVQQVDRVANRNYLFVTLELLADAQPGFVSLELRHEGIAVVTHPFELRRRAAKSAARDGFDASDVIYLITPDRFANGDPTNDDVQGMRERSNRATAGGRHGGDLAGIIQHLDYLQALGITALWLNPVLENNMSGSSYHGYSTTDFYRVDPRFGDNPTYRQLSDRAQQVGIKLIMDMIANHCGVEHWWMKDLPTEDWINRPPRFEPARPITANDRVELSGREPAMTNHRRTTLQDPHAAAHDRRRFQEGWFVPSMPDLNQRQPLLANYLIQNSIWWIEYAGLSGIRMDTYSYSDPDYLAQWTSRIKREYPSFQIVGEEWSPEPTVVAYWQHDPDRPSHAGSSLGSLMDFPLQIALRKALTEPESWNSGWLTVYETLAQDRVYPRPNDLVVFADNHDMSRLMTQVDENSDLFRLGLVFICTTRGVPQIFYGTEIGMSHPGTDRHPIIRSDFPGGWPDDPVSAFTGDGLSAEAASCQGFVRRLLTWRKTATVIHTGKLTHFAPLHDGLYVYFRWNERETVMIVLNKNHAAMRLPLDRYSERIESYTAGVNVLTGETISLTASEMMVPARSPLVLELRGDDN